MPRRTGRRRQRTYDGLGRVTAQDSLGGISLAFGFDANGNRLSQQDPDGGGDDR